MDFHKINIYFIYLRIFLFFYLTFNDISKDILELRKNLKIFNFNKIMIDI